MKYGFTGTQQGCTEPQWTVLLVELKKATEFHHGDCVGADAEAHAIAKSFGAWTVCHPPLIEKSRAFTVNDETREPKDYLVRNHDIVDETAFMIACPKGMSEELRSGTWATIRYARKRGKSGIIIFPDGSVIPLTPTGSYLEA
jgi:hypothetical protein